MHLLSNYTFLVEFSHALLFEKKVTDEIIPYINALKAIEKVSFYRLITEVETDGQNLSLQLYVNSENDFKAFEAVHKMKVLTMLD